MKLNEDYKKLLIDYYKWLVSLATFIITASISVVAIEKDTFADYRLLIVGLLLLGTSIFFNILVIKRIIVSFIIDEKDEYTWLDTLQIRTMKNIKIYGLIQNGSFFLGAILILGYFVIEIL